jgi:MoxR-like ATPase
VGHVRIGRRSGQSLARKRHTGEHEAHSPTRRTFRDNAAEGRQRWLPTVMRKKPLVAFDEIERAAHDLRAKLLGRLQYAVGDEGK